jgi:hypothetical protein
MSWIGYWSPRLQELGFDKVRAYDSPAWRHIPDEILQLEAHFEANSELNRVSQAVASLMKAFCVSANLNNVLALGAIARELHLAVEKLLYLKNPDIPVENNLDILHDSLPSLKKLMLKLHAALSSFAHPGWLVRTELLRMLPEDAKFPIHEQTQALFLSGSYSPKFYGEVDPTSEFETGVRLVSTGGLEGSRFQGVGEKYPTVLREALTGSPRGEILPGEAIDIPFVTFELCRRALMMLLESPK